MEERKRWPGWEQTVGCMRCKQLQACGASNVILLCFVTSHSAGWELMLECVDRSMTHRIAATPLANKARDRASRYVAHWVVDIKTLR